MGDPESAPTRAGSMWSLRDPSGCPNQPKHLSATRGLENHDGREDREEHQALLQNCVFSGFHIYWYCISYLLVKKESLVKPGSPASREAAQPQWDGWFLCSSPPLLALPSLELLTEAHFSCAKTPPALPQQ